MTARKKRILILAPSEICYNPRLVKAADELHDAGHAVTVWNPILDVAAAELYEQFVADRPWRIFGPDVRKRGVLPRFRWAVASAAWVGPLKNLDITRSGRGRRLNKMLLFTPPSRHQCDVVLTNVVELLPLALAVKRQHGAILVYDSQEFFSGQLRSPPEQKTVRQIEDTLIHEADLVLATTQRMASALADQYGLPNQPLRVRNAPRALVGSDMGAATTGIGPSTTCRPLRLIWHGAQVGYAGRGVDTIVEALGKIRSKVRLTLQGREVPCHRASIEAAAARYGVGDLIEFRPPAHPDYIVESLLAHDVGVIAEPGTDENQRLTSSNKLFDYLHAGLAVVAPNLPGLCETLRESGAGDAFPVGEAAGLAHAIDRLATQPDLLQRRRSNALSAAKRMTWTADFRPVLDYVSR